MKCPTCNMTVPVCELCEGCRRQAQQMLESAEKLLASAREELTEMTNRAVAYAKQETERTRQLVEARAEIGTLQNKLGQKHVEIEQLKNSIAKEKESARRERVIAGNLLDRVRDLETKLKAADQAYVAARAVAQRNLDEARKERDFARTRVAELERWNKNQYDQLNALQKDIADLEFRREFPKGFITRIECYFQKHGCQASLTGFATTIEKDATTAGWKVLSILDRDSGLYRLRAYCPPHAMGSETLEALEHAATAR